MAATKQLHLPSLLITGFRGLDTLTLPRLGRVTLLAGKNGVGKTTVLDAVRVYAAGGRRRALSDLLREREEVVVVIDEDGNGTLEPIVTSLFHDRDASQDFLTTIGPIPSADGSIDGTETLVIGLTGSSQHGRTETSAKLRESGFRSSSSSSTTEAFLPTLHIRFGGRQLTALMPYSDGSLREHMLHMSEDPELWPTETKCESLGPEVLGNDKVARFWDNVALTDDANAALEGLRLIFGRDIEGVVLVGDDSPRRRAGRRAVVKVEGNRRPVPLRSLGDGALRLFGVALGIANSRDGFLLIDEAENGIHHSLQRDFWRMVLQTAQANNVQVFATTHSRDCIRGFAQAAAESEDTEGILVRLSWRDGTLRAIEYPEDELAIAAEQGIEVR